MGKRLMVVLAVMFLFCLAPAAAPQETKKKDEGIDIYNYYKDACVDVITTIETESLNAGGSGSGCFINDKGYLLTAAHVVKEKGDVLKIPFGEVKILNYKYEVIIKSKERKYTAELVGINIDCDAAILKVKDIDKNDYEVAKIGNSDKLSIGEKIYVIGSPYGVSVSMTSGIVSQLHQRLDMNYIEDWIQISAPINPGNSGGVLLNTAGEVVGIINAKIIGAERMGYSLPINLANIPQLMKGGVERGYFGAEALLENFARRGTSEEAKIQDLVVLNKLTGIEDIYTLMTLYKNTKDQYAIVDTIKKDSPAQKAGIQKGDVIVKVAGREVKSGMDVRVALLYQEIGKPVEIEIWRAERTSIAKLTVAVSLEKNKENKGNKN